MTKEYSWFKIDCPICENGLRELPKQEQDEPVAYGMRDTMIGSGNRMMYVRLDKGQDGCTVPLYTKPQTKEWIELTKKEYDDIYESNKDNLYDAMMVVATYLKRKNK